MKSEIRITNSRSGVTTIDIEGTIGVPEEWQFDEPAGRVATYEKFQRTLAAISRIRSARIVVNIRSTGGDVGDALLIYDALTASGAAITTRCRGYVASAATIIAQAATEGQREISSAALYLVHNSVATCEGNAGELRRSEALLAKTDERIAGIYAARSGRQAEVFAALMAENNGQGRWMSPSETIAEGLADRLIEGEETPAAAPATPAVPAAPGANPSPVTAPPASRGLPSARANLDTGRLRGSYSGTAHRRKQSAAKPTKLKPVEDPSPTDSRRSANETAYLRDAESFMK